MSTESVAQVETKATKSKILQDVRVIAEMKTYSWRSPEQSARAAEDRCKEFNEFIRDHRSQDDIRLEVERIYKEVCSVCGTEWEPITEAGRMICANCESEISL